MAASYDCALKPATVQRTTIRPQFAPRAASSASAGLGSASGKMYVSDGLQNFGTSLEGLKTSPAPTAAAITQEKDLQTTTFLRGR